MTSTNTSPKRDSALNLCVFSSCVLFCKLTRSSQVSRKEEVETETVQNVQIGGRDMHSAKDSQARFVNPASIAFGQPTHPKCPSANQTSVWGPFPSELLAPYGPKSAQDHYAREKSNGVQFVSCTVCQIKVQHSWPVPLAEGCPAMLSCEPLLELLGKLQIYSVVQWKRNPCITTA